MSKTRPKVCMIVAADNNDVIGVTNGGLPWHIPEDLKYFRTVTTGHPVIMGRKTFESIGSKPLPNRVNYVLSKTLPPVDGVVVLSKVCIPESHTGKVFIIGGSDVFKAYEPFIDVIYLTRIEIDSTGDVKLPFAIDLPTWKFKEAVSITTEKGMALSFEKWKRNKKHYEYIYTL